MTPIEPSETTTPSKRESQRKDSIDTILNAARTCLKYQQKADKISTREIIATAGISPRTFYKYFKDKMGVFEHLLSEYLGNISVRVHELRKSATTVEEFFYNTHLVVFQSAAEDPTAHFLATQNEKMLREAYGISVMEELKSLLEYDIINAINTDLLPAVNSTLLANMIFGSVFELACYAAKEPDVNPHIIADFAKNIYCGGLNAAALNSSKISIADNKALSV